MKEGPAAGTYYLIRIRQRLDEGRADWFAPMELRVDEQGTVLKGLLPDQAALHGILQKVRNLGLELVAVHSIGPEG